MVGCFVLFFFKHTKIRYKELANTRHSFIRKGGLSCGSIRSKHGFYWGGLFSSQRICLLATPVAANIMVKTCCRKKTYTKCLHPPIPLPPIHSVASLYPPKNLHFCTVQLAGALETLSCPVLSLNCKAPGKIKNRSPIERAAELTQGSCTHAWQEKAPHSTSAGGGNGSRLLLAFYLFITAE